MIAEQLLGSVLGDGVGIDQLDDGLRFVQLAVFIPAFLKSLYHILRILRICARRAAFFASKLIFGISSLMFDRPKEIFW